ncbi:hypothetical protein Taro_017597 [Colocasia esculenta]|uniref:Uncharacterized protein n=1 Tax=Colocasia esculenta TaxID=4460 RepID=A0A843UTQ1_COLES|nr:hypothetical protein [Colocasia esculenta]
MTINKVYMHYTELEHRNLAVFMHKLRSRRTLMRVVTGSTEIAMGTCTGRDGLVRSGSRSRRQALSRSDRDERLCRDGLMNAAYWAVMFTGSAPESDKERTLHWIAGQNLPYST